MLVYLQSLVRKCVDFKGRAGHREFWLFALFQLVGVLVISFVERHLGIANPEILVGPVTVSFLLITLVPALAVTVRRLHDGGRNGLWTLMYFVPVIGSMLLIVLMLWRGTPGNNRYGPDPRLASNVPPR